MGESRSERTRAGRYGSPGGSRRGTLLAALCAILVSGAVGWLIGQSTAPVIEIVEAVPVECEPERPPELAADGAVDEAMAEALELSLIDRWRLAARVDSLEALIEDFERSQITPYMAAEQVIGRMPPEDVERAVVAATGLLPFELEEIDDIQAYAMRLVDVALEGLTDDSADRARDEPMAPVYFSTDRATGEGSAPRASSFDADAPRIYAHFSTEHSRVTVKWMRLDRAEILLLKRQSVDTSPRSGWVALERAGAWKQGTYQVTVYTGDEAVTPIAEGRYTVQ